MITIIQFDKLGRPSWRSVDTGKFIHKLDEMTVNKTLEFSESEKAWFRKPLTERS